MKQLTKAEEQIMQVLWRLDKAYLKDILAELPHPKPHNNTVNTLLKILIEKNFVSNEVHGRNHLYFPIVNKAEYSKSSLSNFVENYFEGSFANVVSFMVDSKALKQKDIDLLLKHLKK